MINDLKIYAACFVSIILLDFIWLGIVMKSFYVEQMRPLGRISGDAFQPVLWAAAAVYVVLSIGIVEFVLPRISSETSLAKAFGFGALFGFVVYGTYEFTNYSILKDWTLPVTFADLAWGTFLCGAVTLIARTVRS